jgi:hypothetical protein
MSYASQSLSGDQVQYADYSQQPQYYQQAEQQYYQQPMPPQQYYQPQQQYPAIDFTEGAQGGDNSWDQDYQNLQTQFQEMNAVETEYYQPPQPSYIPDMPQPSYIPGPPHDTTRPDSDFMSFVGSNGESIPDREGLSPIEEEEPAQSVLQTLMNQQQGGQNQIKVGRFEVTRSELSPDEYVERAKNFSIYSDL